MQFDITTPGATETLAVAGNAVITAGSISVPTGQALAVGGEIDQSGGTVDANGGSVAVTGAYNVTGGTVALEGGSITADEGVSVASGAVLSGDGTITGDVTNAGEMDTDSTAALVVSGAYTQTAGLTNVGGWGETLSVGGAVALSGGTLSLGTYSNLVAAGAVTVSGGSFQLNGAWVDAAQVQVASGGVLTGSGTIDANLTNAGEVDVPDYSTLSVLGAYTQTAGVANVGTSYGAELAVSDLLDVQGGTLYLNDATLQAGGGVQIDSGAALVGYGTIDGNLTDSGSLTVGGNPWAQLGVYGNYTQTSGGSLTLDLSQEYYNTSLSIHGQAALDGAFILDSVDGQTPPAGGFLYLAYYGSESGEFASMQLPSLSGAVWEANYTSYSFQLGVEQA